MQCNEYVLLKHCQSENACACQVEESKPFGDSPDTEFTYKKNNAMKMYFWNIANHVSLGNKLTPPLPWPSTYPDNVLFFGPIIREMWLWSVRLLVDYIGVLKWYLKHLFVSRYQLPTHHCFVSHFLLAWIPISKATICAKLQGVLMQSHTITAE